MRHRSNAPLLLGAALIVLGLLSLALVMAQVPQPAAAAPLADLPTATPPPPTPEPSATPPPTATMPPPPPTATTPPPTPDDPPHRRRQPTPTPLPSPIPTATPPPPTAGPPTDLIIEKLADKQAVAPGGIVVFTLRVSTSLGSSAVSDVVVRDHVPEPLQVIDLASARGHITVEGREVTVYPATLAPGEVVLIHVTARVPVDAEPGMIVNTSTVTTSTPGDPPGNNTSSVPVEVVPVFVPQSLPVTADPNEPSLLMSILPWLLVSVLLLTLGAVVLWYRGKLPLMRVPKRGLASATITNNAAPTIETTSALARVSSAHVAAPALHPPLSPWIGSELPPARPPDAIPPRPGTYAKGDDDVA